MPRNWEVMHKSLKFSFLTFSTLGKDQGSLYTFYTQGNETQGLKRLDQGRMVLKRWSQDENRIPLWSQAHWS